MSETLDEVAEDDGEGNDVVPEEETEEQSLEEGEDMEQSSTVVEPGDNDSDEEIESDNSSESEPRRYPSRTRNAPTVFTYANMGGQPSYMTR